MVLQVIGWAKVGLYSTPVVP